MMEYWLRILGALALIKVASTLVRDAEKLITANMKARNPDLETAMNGNGPVVTEPETTESTPEVAVEGDTNG